MGRGATFASRPLPPSTVLGFAYIVSFSPHTTHRRLGLAPTLQGEAERAYFTCPGS